MQTDLSNQLETLITEGRKRSKRGTILLILLGVMVALIGLIIAIWSSRETAQKAKEAAKLAETQAALQSAYIAEQKARTVSLQVNQLIATGAQQAHNGRFSQAAQSYEKALTLDPENTVALQLDGYLEYRRGNLNKAVLLLRHSVSSDPKDPWSRYNLALALNGSGDTAGAIEQIRELIAIDPGFKQTILSDVQFIKMRHDPKLEKLLESGEN